MYWSSRNTIELAYKLMKLFEFRLNCTIHNISINISRTTFNPNFAYNRLHMTSHK